MRVLWLYKKEIIRMKKVPVCLLWFVFGIVIQVHSQVIRISTDDTDLILTVAENRQLYQTYLGEKLNAKTDINGLPQNYVELLGSKKWEVYPAAGGQDFFEPAFAITHNDGNKASVFRYLSNESFIEGNDNNVTHTVVHLKDDVYPINVNLHYVAYKKENIFRTWTEISHNEKKPVTINRYASSMLYFENRNYYLTQFGGNWSNEAQMSTLPLSTGKKVIDSKLGTRAAMQANPFFFVGLDQPASINQGKVLMGTIAWTGNFQFVFEVDNLGNLRVLSGINPYASDYRLESKEVFVTPDFIFTYSESGTGGGTRNFHSWARNYQIKNGKGSRIVHFNNWDTTFFEFDEDNLSELMQVAKSLGAELFLLDDGWFGNKYPRKDDSQGLGDWEVTKSKLPNGIPYLVKTAKENGLKFGIWIEPEMVNPKSELFEKHPDWAIMLPNREPYYERNQLALDMSNPEVQKFTFGIIDDLMKENPDIAYFKWDCNSPITNAYSPYLKMEQNQLYINHVRGVYNLFKMVKEKYPDLPMMLCASGGGRCDFEALKYFDEFWCSDNSNPTERAFIQWGFSQFIPVKAMQAHVTDQNPHASLKFRTDMAMMCNYGLDLHIDELTADEKEFCRLSIANYNRLKNVTLDGNIYHLVSPYEENHMSVMYANEEKNKAVLFVYDLFPRRSEKRTNIKLQGLNPESIYQVEEINLMPNQRSTFNANGKSFSGDYLMKIGLEALSGENMSSKIIEITLTH
jgi:alpha-galactosidase